MSKAEFKALVAEMVELYGVRSYLDNLGVEGIEDDEDDIWVECPECGEPILWEDYGEELEFRSNDDVDFIVCPICENYIDM